MIFLHALLLVFVILPVLLLVGYYIFIQSNRGGLWRVLYLVGIPAAIVDIATNFSTAIFLFWEFPNEWTVSQRLDRLVQTSGWRAKLARHLSKFLNDIDPHHNHIRSFVGMHV
jgi:hypothetical protein